MKRRGPDSLEGLFIAIICCSLSTLMYGPAGLSSMLFVACVARYDTDRNKASYPFILSSVLQAVSGPFTGYLAKRFSVRVVVLAGSVLVPLGIGACFFAEDITTVTVFWGIIFGTGFGLSTLLLPAIINEYFFKQRSKALGMCYLGSPIGFFLFPPIFEVLLNNYGLSGTFLFLSGISMHCIPLSMLLRPPNFKASDENCALNKENRRNSYLSTACSLSKNPNFENGEKSGTNNKIKTHFRRFSIEFLWKKSDSTEHLTDGSKQYVLSLNKTCSGESCTSSDILRSFKKSSKNYYENIDALSKPGRTFEQIMEQTNYAGLRNPTESNTYERYYSRADKTPAVDKSCKSINCKKSDVPKNYKVYEKCSTIYFGSLNSSHTFVNKNIKSNSLLNGVVNDAYQYEDGYVQFEAARHISKQVSNTPTLLKYRKIDEFLNPTTDIIHDEKRNVRTQDTERNDSANNSLLNMYLNPIFILMCIINAISSLHFSTLTTVIIDFSRDLKIDFEYEKYIMMCISVTGGIGMLGFGWVTDGGYLTRTRFGSMSQLIASVSTAALPFSVGFETLMILLAIWCVCQASFIPLIPAIIADYFKEDIQAVAVSAVFVLCGPLYLIIPPLIGYFRDEKGSYSNIFFLLGSLAFLNCIALFSIPYLARWKSKR